MAGAFVSAFVAICFTLSAGFKWRERESFREAIDEFSLLRGLPRRARPVLVRLVPLTEGAVAALVVIPYTSRVGTVAAVSLALAFVVVVGLDSRRTIAHCGCWGVASADVPKSFYLARSGLLLLAAVAAAAATFTSFERAAWDSVLETEAFALSAPFALFLLELPQIAQIVRVQQLARGEPT